VSSAYRLKDVSVRSLRGITVDIPRGGITCVVGPSQAGKSTLLELLAGMLALDSGRLWRAPGLHRLFHHGQAWTHAPRGADRLAAVRRMLANRPDVLLLDEPTKQIDEPSAVQLGALLAAAETTVVMATHDHSLTRRLGGSALVVADGTAEWQPAATIDYLAIQEATVDVLRDVRLRQGSGC